MKIDSDRLKVSDRFFLLYCVSIVLALLALYFSPDVLFPIALVSACLFTAVHMVSFLWAIKDD